MAEIGTGITIAFSSGFFAEVVGLRHTGIERPAIDQSHFGSTNARSFRPGDLYDPGELEVELNFAPGTAPPFNGAAETCTVTHPDSGTSTWAASAFMTGFEYGAPLEDKQTATARLKFSGEITVANP